MCLPTVRCCGVPGLCISAVCRRVFSVIAAVARFFSTHYRGSAKQPGLVLGLDCGGSCNGVVYRVAPRRKKEVIAYLFQREMFTSVYHPRYISVYVRGRQRTALTFVVRRDSRHYAAPMPPETAAAIIARARGHGGSNRDYFYHTSRHLQQLGIASPMLAQIMRLLPPPLVPRDKKQGG